MKKIAFVFPGQGSQYIGMGKDIYENFDIAMEIAEKTKESLGIDLKKIVLDGKPEELTRTEITQPSILMTSIAIMKVLEEKGVKPSVVAGLSLGEYSALVTAGVIEYRDAIQLVRKRGQIMEEAVPKGTGGMVAVLGLDRDILLKELEDLQVQNKGTVSVANYNCPGQIVITGEKEALKIASEKLKEIGAKRVIALDVSGPFHSQLLESAGIRLQEELEKIKINKPSIPMYFNVNAKKIKDIDEIKESLIKQVSNSVYWEETIEKMILEDKIECFIEVGPGKTLTSFVKKINKKHKKEIELFNIENKEDIEKLLKK